jgi:FkbM family methyltransferase
MGIKTFLKRTPLYPYYFARTHTLPAELNEADRRIASLYSEFVRDGSLVFDVGANVGMRTKIFRHLKCRVVAIEPQRNCVAALKHTFGKNVAVVHAAASDREGFADLFTSDHTAVSTISREWIKAMKGSGRLSDIDFTGKEQVRLVPLDSLVAEYGKPDFIKIDVEGHDLSVLRGLSAGPPALSFEFSPVMREEAALCVERLRTLGSYEFNFSFNETAEYQFADWLNEATIVTHFASLPGYGDVYCRRMQVSSRRPDLSEALSKIAD